jgi:hypothetical protein
MIAPLKSLVSARSRLIFSSLLFPSALHALEISANGVTREFVNDGNVWRTSAFATPDGRKLLVTSSEFHIRGLDDAEWTVDDYRSTGEPSRTDGSLTFRYVWPQDKPRPENAPVSVSVVHRHGAKTSCLRKQVLLEFPGSATIDRLEVERFTTVETAARGGRGEPVWIGGRWFFGLEHPAGHSRHTNGNTPKPDSHHYELVGNYSFVDIEGRDREAKPLPGLVRLFHFPGFAKAEGPSWLIRSQTAVTGAARPGEAIEQAFGHYLESIARPARSFTHYNNWFDGEGKSLKGDNLLNIHRQFKEALKGYDIGIDAMVPDDGWQNKASVWEPAANHFPNGFQDLKKLSDALREDGTSLGLWLALDGTNTDVGWGVAKGYRKAKPNGYFSRYFAHYSLSADGYRQELDKQLRKLAGEAGISYLKHDFNHLSDTGEGCNHPATDRHGHEANVEAMIQLLASTREANPKVYQNLTNWIWFSPWWLMHGDALWMLAGDDGFNGNWPELSTRAMATTDRDVYLWRMWGNAADRPLVPVSRLMTHGIIRNPRGQMEGPQDTLRDWADHVMMYYGRGIQMKEWYLTPAAMTPDHWKSLATIHRWSERNFKALANSQWVGGRPDEGHAYGYAGWHENRGVLVARNPGAAPQTLQVPFDAASGFTGKTGQTFAGRVVYPYHRTWPATFVGGQAMEITVPGYETLALEIAPGTGKPAAPSASVASRLTNTRNRSSVGFTVPADLAGRGEVLVIGYPGLPAVTFNGQPAKPLRTSKSSLNQFASYARAGMPSEQARAWQMASFDLRDLAGKPVTLEISAGDSELRAEAWLLVEQAMADEPFDSKDLPWSISAGTARRTTCLVPEREFSSGISRRPLTDAEISSITRASLDLDVFGISAGHGAKSVWFNGHRVGELPSGPDEWRHCRIDLSTELLSHVRRKNVVEVKTEGTDDRFKFRALELKVGLKDGTRVRSSTQTTSQTDSRDWTHFEGEPFPTPLAARPVTLDFGNP